MTDKGGEEMATADQTIGHTPSPKLFNQTLLRPIFKNYPNMVNINKPLKVEIIKFINREIVNLQEDKETSCIRSF